MKPLPQQAPLPLISASSSVIFPLLETRRPAEAPSGVDLRSRGWGERFSSQTWKHHRNRSFFKNFRVNAALRERCRSGDA